MIHTFTQPPAVDFRDLHFIRVVAARGSLTRAASELGLSQSALTRHVQAIEARLGVALFDRTTRRLEPTAAAHQLLRETGGLSEQLSSALRRLGESFANAPREVRIGLSHSVALAHLPGLLHAYQRRRPEVRVTVAHGDRSQLLAAAQEGSLDLAILGDPRTLPPPLKVAHRMSDQFILIGPASGSLPARIAHPNRWTSPFRGWLNQQPWLHFSTRSSTGRAIQDWLASRDVHSAVASEFDNFDMIVHLAAMGLGIGLVPRRALTTFPRRHRLRLLPMPEPFSRDLVVVTRGQSASPQVRDFVSSILFS